MKKFCLMLMLASVLPSLAGQISPVKVSSEPCEMSHREFVMQNNIRPRKSMAAKSGEETVIVTPPAGADIKMYTRSTLGFSVRWGQAYQEKDQGIVGEIAYCDNDDVYLKNPISFYATDSWIKGKKDGSKLTFKFPQLLALVPADEGVEDSEMMEVWINVVTSDYSNGGLSFAYDESVPNEITMTVDDGGNIIYSEEMSEEGGITFPKKMMGLTGYDNMWLGYGDYNNTYKPFDQKPLLIPGDLTSTDYAMTFGSNEINGKWVKVAFDDAKSKIYIAGVYTPDDKGFESLANSAIVGDLMDGGAIFKSRQYVGIDPYYYHAYLSGGSVVSDPAGAYLDIEDIYIMTMDAKRSKLTSSSTMVVSEGENQGYVLDVFYYPSFDAQEGYVDPNPAEPLVTGFMPYTPNYGYGGVKVQIPNTNKNGQLLHDENLSYSIIINDKQIVFDPEEYPEFSEATPWIPFNMSSYNIEIDPYTVNTRMVFMTDEILEVNTISVQSRYKFNDSYYVTNGQTYVYKLPKFDIPTFDPASGYEFEGESGEVTITAPAGSIVSYCVVSDEMGAPNFIDSATNTITLTVDKNCFIQAFSKDPEGDDERNSSVVTATYTIGGSLVKSIAAELGEDVEIYTIDGVRVNSESIDRGLYIVKTGNKTSLIVK